MNNYEQAKKKYEKYGVDVEKALRTLRDIPISIHCWQGDDIQGFLNKGPLSGGIQVTGNYPGKARDPFELQQDLEEVFKYIPGKKRINLHAIYAITDEMVDRDTLKPAHFEKWVSFAKKNSLGIDFNPTFFSHPLSEKGFTLSSNDEEVRKFWVRHAKACREIAAHFGKELKSPSLHNIWIPDGYKDTPADRLGPRLRLKKSLDEIYEVKYDKEYIIDAVESKVFGIGVESYTVGSSEFYLNYAARNNIFPLLDNGHYHPTEMVSDKLSSMLAFFPKVALHVTRPVRWDSDHVVLFEDEIKEIAKEIVRADATSRVLIGLDYFDASINRLAAWIIGTQSMQKALLFALLEPNTLLSEYQNTQNYTALIATNEEVKLLPFGEIWDEYCRREKVLTGLDWLEEINKYEQEVLRKRD